MRPIVILEFLEQIPEPRVERTRRHRLTDILVITLCAVIRGQRGWDGIAEFGEAREAELREFLELPHGIPCADTFRRVMSALDAKAVSACLTAWARQLHAGTDGGQIAIDGKTVRGSFSSAENGEGRLHVVNAWATETKLVLGQFATDVKSNEITAIPELLKLLDLRKGVVSIDAMGCQKNIAKTICEKGAYYLFGLKGNQPTLHEEVCGAFDEQTCNKLRENPHDFHESADKGHGRMEVRRTWVIRDVAWLTASEAWPGLKSLVLVESERHLKDRSSRERRAYISSHEGSAERLGTMVRQHWGIENQLHWTLDVSVLQKAA